MDLSNFLAILDIVVTVFIGFVITHMVAVRDSRTRSIKDYYIQELANIKSEINDFYSKLFNGKLSSRDIIGWNSSIKNRVDNIDNAVRKTFRIYEAPLAKRLFRSQKFITGTDDFNASFNQEYIEFSAPTKKKISDKQKELYMLIEQTLYDINNARTRDYVERKWLELKSHYFYYLKIEKKDSWVACLKIGRVWLWSQKSNILVLVALLVVGYVLSMNVGGMLKNEKDDLLRKELIERMDTLNAIVEEMSKSYRDSQVIVEHPSSYVIRLNQISSSDTTSIKGCIKAAKAVRE